MNCCHCSTRSVLIYCSPLEDSRTGQSARKKQPVLFAISQMRQKLLLVTFAAWAGAFSPDHWHTRPTQNLEPRQQFLSCSDTCRFYVEKLAKSLAAPTRPIEFFVTVENCEFSTRIPDWKIASLLQRRR